MSEKKRGKRDGQKSSGWGDVRLLLCAALFLGGVVLKSTDAPWAEELRNRTVTALRGGIPAQQVLQAAGQTLDEGDFTAVFALWEGRDAGETADEEQGEQIPDALTNESTMVYAESGYGEDELSARTESKFPKEEDETVYVLSFATAAPVTGVRTSAFGARIHPISGEESFHYGLDIAADEGTPIAAFADGTVRETGFSSSYGNYVIVDHSDGFATLYAHCSAVRAVQDQQVKAGETIAAVGATGIATGDHLHFEIWRDGKALDPAMYLCE